MADYSAPILQLLNICVHFVQVVLDFRICEMVHLLYINHDYTYKYSANMLLSITSLKCNLSILYVLCFLGPRQITASSGLGNKNPTDITPMFSSTYYNITSQHLSNATLHQYA